MNTRPHIIENHRLHIRRTLPINADNPQEHNTSVYKLIVYGTDDELIWNGFEQYGNICSLKKIHNNLIIVEFDHYDPIDKIILKKTTLFVW
ncbi:unnamed protein product [Didymodactylos carnosus]|uniref:Uncharacterized protein n=1 Tax=Didymodactylos carnosus TaxID=1234261 RepID=A0A8S2ZPL3_9BILA|nr:unnamed protein product [Didymodactylos carnosus]